MNFRYVMLNPYISLAGGLIILILLLFLENEPFMNVLAFIFGFFITLPLIFQIWESTQKNWKSVYREFYTGRKYKKKIIKKAWTLSWWIVPYCIIIYFVATILVTIVFGLVYRLPMIYGALLCIFIVSFSYQRKLWREEFENEKTPS